MDKLTAIKIKYDDGTYSDEIPVSVLSENVEWDNTHTLVDVLGSIDVDVTGTIQNQISQLFNEKVSETQLQNYISSSMPTYINSWLNTNVNPVGSAVVVDSSLTISGAAADAKVVGDLKSTLNNVSIIEQENTLDINWLKLQPNKVWGTTSFRNNDSFTCTGLLQCKTGDKIKYNLSISAEFSVFARFNEEKECLGYVEGNGWSTFISGEYTFTDTDKYFILCGVKTYLTDTRYMAEYNNSNDISKSVSKTNLLENKVGNDSLNTSAQTLTGAINELNEENKYNSEKISLGEHYGITNNIFLQNPNKAYHPTEGYVRTNEAFTSSNKIPCKAGDVIEYASRMSSGFAVFITWDKFGNVITGIDGNGQSKWVAGIYTCGNNDAYFAVGAKKTDAAADLCYVSLNRTKNDYRNGGARMTEITRNLIRRQPVFNVETTLVADLGEEITAPDLTISFTAKNWTIPSSFPNELVYLADSSFNKVGSFLDTYFESTEGLSVLKNPGVTVSGRFVNTYSFVHRTDPFRYIFITNSPSRGLQEGVISDWQIEIGTQMSEYSNNQTLIDYIARGDITKIKNAIREYPPYWKDTLEIVMTKIKAKKKIMPSGDMFSFVTDIHQGSNSYHSPEILDYIARKAEVPLIVVGGDIVTSSAETVDSAIAEIDNYYDSFKKDGYTRIFSTIGNHDRNNNNNPDSSLWLSDSQLYQLFVKREELFTDTENTVYCNYYDNPSQKIRYIQFYYDYDRGYLQEAETILRSKMAEPESGWTIVLFSHAYWYDAEHINSDGERWSNTIMEMMDSIDATVACWIVGHLHNDRSAILTSTGGKKLNIIGCSTDAYGQSRAIDMRNGTITETVISMFAIDTTNKTVDLIRIGAGADRSFTY